MRSNGQERNGRLGTWVAIVFMAIVLTGCTCCYTEQAYPVAHCLPPDCHGMSPYWDGQVLAPGWSPAPNVPYPPSSTGRAVPPWRAPAPYPVHGAGPTDGTTVRPEPGEPRDGRPISAVHCVCVVNQTASPVQGHVRLHCQGAPPIDVPVSIPQGGHQCWPIRPPCILQQAEYDLGVCRGACPPMPPPPPGPVTLIVCAQGGGPIGPVTCTCVFHPGPDCPQDPAQLCPPYRPH